MSLASSSIHGSLEAIHIISTHTISEVFQVIDADKDGIVSVDELELYFHKLGLGVSSSTMLSLLIAEQHEDAELHYSRHLDFERFNQLCKSVFEQRHDPIEGESADERLLRVQDEEEKDLMEVFRVYDINGDGFISAKEVEMVLRRLRLVNSVESKRYGWERVIAKADTNGDGVLDFTEFKMMMKML